MSKPSSGDVTKRHPQATILTSLTAILETAVQRIHDEDLRVICIPVAPFVALIIVVLIKTWYNRFKCSQTKKMLKNWIEELNREIENPLTAPGRRKAATREVQQHKAELKKVETDFIGIVFD